MLPKVHDISPSLGCDPEFFFKFKGEVIGAEKFIPKQGLEYNPAKTGRIGYDGAHTTTGDGTPSKFIIDGVQAELNPRPNYCRANLANEIAACFKTLKNELDKRGKGFEADFSRTVEISKDRLAELDEKSRKFGCAPSLNLAKETSGVSIDQVDPEVYRVRAAGGHIHIGGRGPGVLPNLDLALGKHHEKTVAMLDLLCGNTMVLVDRDPGNIERRKVYGKASEYRLPKHGLEYRTLSNCWLTSYPLFSLAFGMARLAVQVVADSDFDLDKPKQRFNPSTNKYETRAVDFFEEFSNKVPRKNITDAINANDFDLAMDNYTKIEPLILQVSGDSDRYAIHTSVAKEFHHFVNVVKTKGLEHWFPQDPMTHWTTITECHAGGFSDYLSGTVRQDMKKLNSKVA